MRPCGFDKGGLRIEVDVGTARTAARGDWERAAQEDGVEIEVDGGGYRQREQEAEAMAEEGQGGDGHVAGSISRAEVEETLRLSW